MPVSQGTIRSHNVDLDVTAKLTAINSCAYACGNCASIVPAGENACAKCGRTRPDALHASATNLRKKNKKKVTGSKYALALGKKAMYAVSGVRGRFRSGGLPSLGKRK